MQVGEAFVAVRPDTRGFAGQLKGDVTAAAGPAGSAAGQAIGRQLQAVLVGGAALKFFQSAIGAASDLNEAVSLTGVTFQGAQDQILAMGEDSAETLGLAEDQALSFANSIGGLLIGLGSTRTEAASMSQDILQLGADLASAKNLAGGTGEALEVLRSGIVGEVEPLRRLGVAFNAAQVEQRALADTGKDSAASLTEGEKAAARYAIIVEQLGRQGVVGDFERTAGGAANQQRIFNAELRNAQAELGQALLPAFISVLGALREGLPLISQTGTFFTASASGAQALASVVGPLAGLVGDLNTELSDLTFGLGDLTSIAPGIGQLNTLVESFKQLVEGGIEFAGVSLGGDGGFDGLIADTEGGVERIEELFNQLDVSFGAGSFEEFALAVRDAAGAAGIDLADALDRLGITGDSAAEIIALVGVNTIVAGEAVGALAGEQERLAEVTGRTDLDAQAEALTEVADAADEARDKLDALFGIQRSVAEGAIDIRDGARDLLAQLVELGEGGYRPQTEAGDAFLSSLQEQAQAIADHTLNVAATTGSFEQARGAQNQYIGSLLQVARAAGVPERELQALIRTHGSVPRRLLMEVAQAGAQGVQRDLRGVRNRADQIPDQKTIAIGADTSDFDNAFNNTVSKINSLPTSVNIDFHGATPTEGRSAVGLRSRGRAETTAGGGGGEIHVHLHGPFYGDPDRLAREIAPAVGREIESIIRRS